MIIDFSNKLLSIFKLEFKNVKKQSAIAKKQGKMKWLILILLMPVFGLLQAEKPKNPQVFIYPILGASDETGVIYGAFGIIKHLPKNDIEKSPNIYKMQGTYSSKKQLNVKLYTQLNFSNEKKLFNEFAIKDRPNTFYGVGNNTQRDISETFDEQSYKLSNDIYLPLNKRFKLNLSFFFRFFKILKYEENGMLEVVLDSQKKDFLTSGLGGGFIFDSSNHNYYPTKGCKFLLQTKLYHSIFGSNYDFMKYRLESNYYFPLHPKIVLAFQGLFMFSEGDIPFQELFQLGANLRGIKKNRFIDKNLFVVRSELRVFPFSSDKYERIGFVVFGEFGKVAPEFEALKSNENKLCFGGGLRYQLFPKEKINLRADFGLFENSYGFTVNIQETF